jgi:hypothetical protein
MTPSEKPRENDEREKSDEGGLYSGGEDEKGSTGDPDMGRVKKPQPFEVPHESGSDG